MILIEEITLMPIKTLLLLKQFKNKNKIGNSFAKFKILIQTQQYSEN
jgi:hypothetical protein